MPKVFQCTVSGIDAGGFAWQNVFHVSSNYAGVDSDFVVAGALNQFIATTLGTPWAAAINDQSTILAVSSRCIDPVPNFTNVLPFTNVGVRILTPALGAVCGRLVFLPTAAPLHVSSMFINNGCEGDYVKDQLQAGYQGLLEDLGDAFLLFDGTTATYEWQLIQWHVKTSDAADLDEYYVSPNPTTLNKRIRA